MIHNETEKPIKVLFVCTHNSGRSLIAEAYLNGLGEGRFLAESAGLEPREANPLVVEGMKEEGFDLAGRRGKNLFEFFKEGRLYDYVIYVCDRETEAKCPVFPGVRRTMNWSFPDPASLQGTQEEKLRAVRGIRDSIQSRIRAWIGELG
ncbi:MAG: arsenate reductase ArsC [Deltaproteobacteria bacterium]|nr:arsenate reductase ArsC [Deltaproteobacteria bacterium]